MKKANTILQRIKLLNAYTEDKYKYNKTPFGNAIYKNDKPFLENNDTTMLIALGGICYRSGLTDLYNNIIVS